MTRFGRPTPAIIGVALAFAPLLVFLYLSHFSRLTADDYSIFGKALEIGAWDGMLFWRENWTGEYTSVLLSGLLAPVSVVAPSLFPFVIAATALLGFLCMTLEVLAFLRVGGLRLAGALALAALAVAACFNGFFTGEALFWYTAAMDYAFPPAVLLLCLALAVGLSRRLKTRRRLTAASVLAAALAIISGGFGEMALVFQLSVSALLFVAVLVFAPPTTKRIYGALAGAGCLGFFASLLLQLTAPGIGHRGSLAAHYGTAMRPLRDLGELLGGAIDLALQYAGHESAFAGFMLLAAASLFACLTIYAPPAQEAKPARVRVDDAGLWLALIAQAALLPYLWAHSSEGAQFFWRFSFRYSLILSLNLAAILALALLLIKRGPLGAALNRRGGFMLYCSLVLLAILALFVMTQALSIHYRISSYLTISAFSLLVALSRQLAAAADESRLRHLGWLAPLSIAIAGLTLAALIGVSLWAQGFVYERTLTASVFALVAAGLFWGLAAGAALKAGQAKWRAAAWIGWIRLASLLLALTIGGGIAISQAKRINDFRAAAQVWDESHQEILALRDAGSPKLDTDEFPYLMPSRYDSTPNHFGLAKLRWGARLYYGLDYEPDFG